MYCSPANTFFFHEWDMLAKIKQICILKLNFKSCNYGKNQTKNQLIFSLKLYATVLLQILIFDFGVVQIYFFHFKA